MNVGLDGDTRKFRHAKKTDYSAPVQAANEQKPERTRYCVACGIPLEPLTKEWNGYCLRCFNEPL